MLFTALHPAPPTPTTVMRGRNSCIVCGTVRLIVMRGSLRETVENEVKLMRCMSLPCTQKTRVDNEALMYQSWHLH